MPKGVWEVAKENGRDYITPEDIADAAFQGADEHTVWQEVLEAIDAKSAEDASLCAFVALRKFGYKSGRDRK